MGRPTHLAAGGHHASFLFGKFTKKEQRIWAAKKLAKLAKHKEELLSAKQGQNKEGYSLIDYPWASWAFLGVCILISKPPYQRVLSIKSFISIHNQWTYSGWFKSRVLSFFWLPCHPMWHMDVFLQHTQHVCALLSNLLNRCLLLVS